MLVSEIVILRKELHEMHFKLDDMTNAKQCVEAKVKTLQLDLADAHADKSQTERKIGMLQTQIDYLKRENTRLKESQNCIAGQSDAEQIPPVNLYTHNMDLASSPNMALVRAHLLLSWYQR